VEEAASGKVTVTPDIRKGTKIGVFSSKLYIREPLEAAFRAAGFEDSVWFEATLGANCAKLAEHCKVVCLFVNDDCNKEVVQKLKELGVELIVMRCAGYDRVDLAACAEAGIKVARVPTYSPSSVAEHALTLLMCVNRKVHIAYQRMSLGDYGLAGLVGRELKGKKVGVLGTGAIGAEAVRCFKGIGMEVLAYDIRKNPVVEAMGVTYLPWEEILPQVDVLSLHLPLLPSTQDFMDRKKFDMLKPGCILINVSRGGLVDSEALLDAIENGRVGGAGLDVYENEGQLFFTDWSELPDYMRMTKWDRTFKVLFSYPQTVLTPHSAFLTNEALANISETTATNIEQFLAGGPLTNEVKPPPSS